MNTNRTLALAMLLAASLGSMGCHRSIADSTSAITAKAQQKIAEQNLSLGDHDGHLPDAELTPQGDLLIGGNKVAVTAEQHALLVQYRQQLEKIARDGVAIGIQGVDLAGKAVSTALSSIVSGDSEGTNARIESEAGKIKASARQLCADLPGLLSTQQKLAAALPEFRPYATMTNDDSKDCQ